MKRKTIMTIAIIVILVCLMFIACYGVALKDKNKEVKKIIPDFKMGMEFTTARRITATINDGIMSQTIYDAEGNEVTEKEEGVEYTEENGYRIEEEKINPDSIRTLENYRIAEEKIREKLEKIGVAQYEISLNEENGEMIVDIPEYADTETLLSALQSQGTLMFFDTSTFETVFDNTYVKDSSVVTRQGDLQIGVFLQIELTDEGKAKIKELTQTNNTDTATNQTQENETNSETTTGKDVLIILNGMLLGNTEVSNIVYEDTIMIPFGVSSNTEEINAAVRQAQIESIVLNAGMTPISYSFTDETIQSTIQVNTVLWCIGIAGAMAVLMLVFLVFKFKAKGFISFYLQLGYMAVLLLVVRLTQVILTVEGIAGLIVAFILNYIFNYIVLKNLKENDMYKKSNLSFLFTALPIYIISIIFTFSVNANVASFGTTIFWGFIITYIYNFIFSKFIYENITGGNNENS